MDYGVHLPIAAFDGKSPNLNDLLAYTETAALLGFSAVAANDHLLWPRPWLDGPTALAAVLSRTGHMTLATTVSLPVVRGPVALAKTLAALDVLSGARLQVGVGPGSSARDYAAVGLDFEERWKRLDEVILALRALWQRESQPFIGRFYDTTDITLEPYPVQQPTPPLWIGSWGSQAGLRRVARLGDGWLASAYNTTPMQFAEGLTRLNQHLIEAGKSPATFPNALATMFCYVTDSTSKADRIVHELLAPAIKRPEAELCERLLVGTPEACAEKLAAYAQAGVQRVFLWPVADATAQLILLRERVIPLVTA